jgi:hypothetical protein
MTPTEMEYWKQAGRDEGRTLIAEDRDEARKAFAAWRQLIELKAIRSEADRLKAEGFVEVAAAEFGEG